MNPNQSRTFWISIGLAVFAMFLVYSHSQEKKAQYDEQFGTTQRVLVAAKDILEMSTIDDTMVTIEERPAGFIQPKAIKDPDEAISRIAGSPIIKGEQILSTKLLEPGIDAGLAREVAPGKRAVTIPVDEVRGVSKLIRPGDRVDIVTSIEYGRGNQQKREVKTLLQDVVVLATGIKVTNNIPRALEKGPGGKFNFRNLKNDTSFSTITIEATPQDAQKIIYIMSSSPGAIYLTLRNPNDRTSSSMATASVNSVLGRSEAPVVRVPAAVPKQIKKPAPRKLRRQGSFEEIR